jgi:hypothetical protein
MSLTEDKVLLGLNNEALVEISLSELRSGSGCA